jgi:hypothetical protein
MITTISIRFQSIMSGKNRSIFEIELNPAVRRIVREKIIVPIIINNLPTFIAIGG